MKIREKEGRVGLEEGDEELERMDKERE